ncbi:hypothetical protein SCHPADRAFT_384786 [Schizopora paradoxa]|uniref:Uncharacterized protein n=1 Tax=Schizopora paradoxa TaxID=27342 RepID=A0A0H2RMC4_9AGAM|nr:hypothetical protein SCHPADRAFT_384786 [Schizopora paradoxa]
MSMTSLRDKLFQIPARVKSLRNDCRAQNKAYFPSMFARSFDLQTKQVDALYRISANFLQMEALWQRARLVIQGENSDRDEGLETPSEPPRVLKKITLQLDAVEEDVYEIAVLLRTRAIQQQLQQADLRSRTGMQIKMAVGKALSFTTTQDLRIVKTPYDRTLLWLAAVRKLEFEPGNARPAVNTSADIPYQLQVRPSLRDAQQQQRLTNQEEPAKGETNTPVSRAANSLFLVRDELRKNHYSDRLVKAAHQRKTWPYDRNLKPRRLWAEPELCTNEDAEDDEDAYYAYHETLDRRCTTAKMGSRKDDDNDNLYPDSRGRLYTLHSVDFWGTSRYQTENQNE